MPVSIEDCTSLLGRFGLQSFRPGQQQVIESILAGHDVLCVMPTGGGKSLCYQLPAIARPGVTLVVSPLIALMKDQVDGLRKRGIMATLINSTLTPAEQNEVELSLAKGEYSLVYVAPERLRNGRFLDAIRNINVSLLAIDEAHCVSEWGHDFRPDYARLGQFRSRYLNNVQTVALTATATPYVRGDIQTMLGMKVPKQFVTGFARTNLRFTVQHSKSDREKNDALVEYLQNQNGAGIIYAATRKRCEELAEWLPKRLGKPIGVYHAGLDSNQRHQVQNEFMSGQLPVMIATNAFGMGIDKHDIRFVVHFNMPGSLEAYYQEAGRAGRDGKLSECRLLFSYADRYVQEFFIENRYPSPEVVQKVYDYLLSREIDPIELTLEEVRTAIGVSESAESIGTAETLLAKAGVLKRLDNSMNTAIIRIDSDLPTLVDLLPREAKIRRKVLRAAEKIIGTRRNEDVYVRPQKLAELAEVEREALARSLRELSRLKQFDYVPPFRGRAIHILRRDLTFKDLKIDFAELDKRKAAEYEKLESVIEFARTPRCRQRAILAYFGDPQATDCQLCDRCDPPGHRFQDAGSEATGSATASKLQSLSDKLTVAINRDAVKQDYDQASFQRGIRIVLSGIARMHGRFGKSMIAQMLGGSNNKKIVQWKLNRLSTFGMLSGLKQSQLTELIDCVIESGLAMQVEVEDRRPTVKLTADGEAVMRASVPWPNSLQVPYVLAKRLAVLSREIESNDVQQEAKVSTESASSAAMQSDETVSPAASSSESRDEATIDQSTQELMDRLKRWRGKTSAALGLPAYRVLTNATIQRIAEQRPQNSTELEAIQGIGPATIEAFGNDIVQLIADYQSSSTDQTLTPAPATAQVAATPSSDSVRQSEPKVQHHMEPKQHSEPKQDQGAQQDAYWTWRLFRDGYSWYQIKLIRGRNDAELTIELRLASKAGHAIQAAWVVGTQAATLATD